MIYPRRWEKGGGGAQTLVIEVEVGQERAAYNDGHRAA